MQPPDAIKIVLAKKLDVPLLKQWMSEFVGVTPQMMREEVPGFNFEAALSGDGKIRGLMESAIGVAILKIVRKKFGIYVESKTKSGRIITV